jgi:hypothetical protein
MARTPRYHRRATAETFTVFVLVGCAKLLRYQSGGRCSRHGTGTGQRNISRARNRQVFSRGLKFIFRRNHRLGSGGAREDASRFYMHYSGADYNRAWVYMAR